ncbi:MULTISPECIES: DegT/DnrJ/EryC1/StrS family aminotransferase [unclassified Pseudomonas]|uniref:DegT/DnrJ/EryC1/StrS family aminotransferase n=1 Tax=unclassified Pseudomonas TaxID=196821 RepID=UPI001B32E0FA|nr:MULTISPECIES: DegT/DnrJ/EryC1/StrS family aminotransferase [unclassified Pseudomonas]MBP5945324.1 DegT/DnrJ/EryC1/StrS family aminotransferase [Pseudomonas sp. P9(2020)]MBZ9563802.1 DegT/DnrJ/EryC1/StrS family aminotransferase [Pseudomonas sp. P116]
MIPVTRTHLPELDVYTAYLKGMWESGVLTNNGPLVKQLGAELSSALGVTHLQLVTNGTLALQLAIKALGLQGEIITTPYSYVATTNSILWEGCTPRFVDVDAESFCIDPYLIEAAITEKTSAILATHVYGYPCDVDRIQEIADRHDLKVIYDAAHAYGVRLHGQSVLNHGDCSTLSFHATKLFHTGEGGAIVFRDKEVADGAFLMSKFGHLGEDDYIDLGINAKMSELHAAMGLSMLPHVSSIIEARRQCSAWYDEFLAGTRLQRPQVVSGLDYNYAYYPVVFETHQIAMAVREALNERGVFPRRYFHPSLNTLPFLDDATRSLCPTSESLASRVLSLPLYTALSQKEISMISTCIKNVLES